MSPAGRWTGLYSCATNTLIVNDTHSHAWPQQEVCFQYWPHDKMSRYGEFSIEILSSNQYDGYTERVLSIVTDKVKEDTMPHVIKNTPFTPDI